MKRYAVITGLLLFAIASCKKESSGNYGAMLMAGIKGSKGAEIVCVNIDSNQVVKETPIESYVLSSTVFDPGTNGYGYVNDDSLFILTRPETGEVIKSFKLPGYLGLAVIDSEDNTLIGIYTVVTYGPEPDSIRSAKSGPAIYNNHLIRVSLSSGDVLSDNLVDLGDGVNVSTYYYVQKDKIYVLYGANGNLIFLNPSSGEVLKEQSLGKILNNSFYITDKNYIVSLDYSINEQKNYITVINPSTGAVVSSYPADAQDGFISNISGFDEEENCYITVNSNFEVLFYDISTGHVKRTYKLENPMNDIKFWRREAENK